MRKENISVLIAASEKLDSYYLNLALSEQGITQVNQVGLDQDEIVRQMVKNNHSVLFLDVIGQDSAMAEQFVQSMIKRTGSHVVAIGDNQQIAFYRAMMACGATEYLTNPIEPNALASIDFTSYQKEESEGNIIAVVGAKGGVGTSTIAANLALSLSQRNEQVAIADMDFSAGSLDLQLNVDGSSALVEMLQYPERLEPVVYQRSGIEVNPNLTLFTGYMPLESEPFWPEKSALDYFAKFSLHHASHLILDIPSFSLRDQVGFSQLSAADIRVLVIEPTLASIRNAGQILKNLTSAADHSPGKINILLLNHTKSEKASLIYSQDVQKALGFSVDVELPFAPTHFLTNDSLGKSALKGDRKVQKAFKQLTDLVQGQASSAKSSFWKRRA